MVPYNKELLDQGKEIIPEVIKEIFDANEKRHIDNICVIMLKWMTFIGMGEVYLFKKGLNAENIFNKLVSAKGFELLDEYVLELYKMPYSSPKGLEFCNDLFDYANLILTKYMTDISDEKEELIMLSRAMLAMYTIGIIFGHSAS